MPDGEPDFDYMISVPQRGSWRNQRQSNTVGHLAIGEVLMSRSLLTLTALSLLGFSVLAPVARAQDETEISLFDARGEATAYVALDDEYTIYLWHGKPVAYLYSEPAEIHIYGFNGKHLGWYDRGILLDHQGNAAGFRRGALATPIQLEPWKSWKEWKPWKAWREWGTTQAGFHFKMEYDSTSLVFLERSIGSDREGRLSCKHDPLDQ